MKIYLKMQLIYYFKRTDLDFIFGIITSGLNLFLIRRPYIWPQIVLCTRVLNEDDFYEQFIYRRHSRGYPGF
jgi:hypothetical protein